MRRAVFLAVAAAAAVATSAPAPAQVNGVAPPAVGSAQRRAILDALRGPIASHLQQYDGEITFLVSRIGVADGWALVVAEPRRRDGRPIDGARVFGDMWQHMDGLTVSALLRFERGRWRHEQSQVGAPDVWYCGRAGPPPSLLGC